MIRIKWNETAFKIGNVKCPIWMAYIKFDTNMRVGPKKIYPLEFFYKKMM